MNGWSNAVGVLLLVFSMAGCGLIEGNGESEVGLETTSSTTEKETSKPEKNTKDSTGKDEYPMPILAGWEEEEIVFETIGGGQIDVWHGEFKFEGEIEEYFEPYQSALKDMGFEVEVTQDAVGMKTLEISKVIDGDKHVGVVLFTQGWVKSSLQHFK